MTIRASPALIETLPTKCHHILDHVADVMPPDDSGAAHNLTLLPSDALVAYVSGSLCIRIYMRMTNAFTGAVCGDHSHNSSA